MGMIWERLWEAVEAAVEGLWALYPAIWASERDVVVRPGCAVSPHTLQFGPGIIAHICGEAHASQLSGKARGYLASGRRIVLRPIAAGSAGLSRSQGPSVLL